MAVAAPTVAATIAMALFAPEIANDHVDLYAYHWRLMGSNGVRIPQLDEYRVERQAGNRNLCSFQYNKLRKSGAFYKTLNVESGGAIDRPHVPCRGVILLKP